LFSPSGKRTLRDNEEKKVGKLIRRKTIRQQDSVLLGDLPFGESAGTLGEIPEDEEVDVTQIMQFEIERQKRKQKQ